MKATPRYFSTGRAEKGGADLRQPTFGTEYSARTEGSWRRRWFGAA